MAYPVNRTLLVERVYAHNIDQSSAGSSFAVSPCRGKIVLLGTVVHVAVTSAPNVLTAKVAGTSITIPTWTATATAGTGGTAGDVIEVVPTAANTVTPGQNIEFISDGAGSSTVPCTYYADISTDVI